MAKAQASLGVTVAVFGFDPSPDTASNRALHVLSVRQGLPKAELDARETFEAAGVRAVEEAGIRLDAGRKGRGRLHLVGVDDAPGSGRSREVTAWYYATVPYADIARPAVWSVAGRGTRFDAADTAAFRAALDRLRADVPARCRRRRPARRGLHRGRPAPPLHRAARGPRGQRTHLPPPGPGAARWRGAQARTGL